MMEIRTRVDDIGVNDIERIIGVLLTVPPVDADQLEQIRRHAERRRELIQQVDLLPPLEFAPLIPQLADSGHPSVSMALGLMTESHQLLRLRHLNCDYYPTLQVDTQKGHPFPDLRPIIKRARRQGYTDWEILDWLVRPYCLPDNTPGDIPLPDKANFSLQELVDAIQRHHPAGPVEEPIAPIDLLRSGERGKLKQYVADWLGHEK